MQNLGVREAANAIRGAFATDQSVRTDPSQAHQMKFVVGVCSELGVEASPQNVHHVATLLREHGIDLPAGQEYPKYAVRDHDKTSKIVHDANEEDEWVHETPPTPVAALREQTAPVQDLGLDLVDQVPKHVDHNADFNPEPLPGHVEVQHNTDDHSHEEHEVAGDDDVHVEDVPNAVAAADAAPGDVEGTVDAPVRRRRRPE